MTGKARAPIVLKSETKPLLMKIYSPSKYFFSDCVRKVYELTEDICEFLPLSVMCSKTIFSWIFYIGNHATAVFNMLDSTLLQIHFVRGPRSPSV